MATSVSGRDAHESGGGAGARRPSSSPATTVTVVVRPSGPGTSTTGVSRAQSIEKYGSASFDSPGRLSQIWNSSSGFGASSLSSGNISECTMPRPAVSHWVSPLPKRAAAPSESAWSMSPRRT